MLLLLQIFLEPTDGLDAKLCTIEMALPDVATLHGRLYLGAWEQGLSSVADDSALLLSRAVEVWTSTYALQVFAVICSSTDVIALVQLLVSQSFILLY